MAHDADANARLVEALGFDPRAVMVAEPGLLLDRRFVAALHGELERDLGADDAAVALLQIGLLHGLRDAARWVTPLLRGEGRGALPPSPTLAIRFQARPDGGGSRLELTGSWPERGEAGARVSALGRPLGARSCWLSAGYTSGWLSGVFETDVLALESCCSTAGDGSCGFVAREAAAWRGDPGAEALLEQLPFAAFRALAAEEGPPPPRAGGPMEGGEPAIHIWGPVMVIPFAGPDEAMAALELIGNDPGAAQVSVVVLDLSGAIVDEAFGAAALEQIVERSERWGLETVFAGVSPLSEPAVRDLARQPVMVRKDLDSAIVAAFQIADAQRRAV